MLAAAQIEPLTVGPQPTCDFADLQAALDEAATLYPAEVEIRVNENVEIADPPLMLRGARVILEGGYFDCGSQGRGRRTNLSGRGEARVLVVADSATDPDRGSRLILRHIQVLNGRAFIGAGIFVGNHSEVRLEGSNVIGNVADLRGGGVLVLQGSTLRVSGDSRISANEAGHRNHSGQGAGVYCGGLDGAISVVRLDDGAEISGNFALRNRDNPARGGGFFLSSNCNLEMAGDAGVLGNSADEGGGGYLEQATARLLPNASEATIPRFENNRVTGSGGALSLADGSTVEMERAVFINNGAAPDASGVSGGALHLTGGSRFESLVDQNPDVPPACPQGPACPRFLNNHAELAPLAMVGENSELRLRGALIADNAGLHAALVTSNDPAAGVTLSENFLVRNSVSNILHLDTESSAGNVSFTHNTIADNPGLRAVLSVDAPVVHQKLIFENNLVMGDDVEVFSGGPGVFDDFESWRCHAGSSLQERPFDHQVLVDNPDFVDAANLDYHLGPGSGAIDVCDDLQLDSLDIDGDPRPINHPSVDGERTTDAGADEVRVLDNTIFRDRFQFVQ